MKVDTSVTGILNYGEFYKFKLIFVIGLQSIYSFYDGSRDKYSCSKIKSNMQRKSESWRKVRSIALTK